MADEINPKVGRFSSRMTMEGRPPTKPMKTEKLGARTAPAKVAPVQRSEKRVLDLSMGPSVPETKPVPKRTFKRVTGKR